MNDYTPYRMTFHVDKWTHIPLRDEWQDPRHIFGGRAYLKREIVAWLAETPGDTYAVLDDEEHFVNHVIAFSQPRDASMFLLRWS